ncbi:hypothetical protein H696_05818 [Fonticula alba]|uniref:MIP18 family-like domain-containing protein n=1 Tax=Fonticula alba TaxID=691883 RepID=A0A058Z0C4_FONAL|nr:hypothetical protein H696_05818 [Fonticula alba]KCV67710.1 hypothetical protein H696_05818 [Fonticula alba]|eukprot:XP_009497894.1 hypothetical protein H696_05818 [Fonticula alba]
MLGGHLVNPNPVVHPVTPRDAGSVAPDVAAAALVGLSAAGRAPGSAALTDASGIVTATEVFEFIRDIKDPEHPFTLEQLRIVRPENVYVLDRGVASGGPARADGTPAPASEVVRSGGPGDDGHCYIRVEFTPTVPHCSLATLIGLCLRKRLERSLGRPIKLDINVTPGSHQTEHNINKQINDKERVAAAFENPSLHPIVEDCIRDSDY